MEEDEQPLEVPKELVAAAAKALGPNSDPVSAQDLILADKAVTLKGILLVP